MTVSDTSIRKESRDKYLTYALSVVTGRALPDVRDGLKPVQRRILYAMLKNLSLKPGSSHRKSAAVVGEVLARFHPHGDLACYEAMVRMAQDFSLRYPLVDGQGNFGSLDGDSAAAYRYTEAKLLDLALEVLGEIEEDTVDFRDNFDSTTMEPEVLPSRVPNLLMNGASGIAVGMATNIPPHNLRELIKALIELSNDPDMSTAQLTNIIKGPDFPTGCLILNSKAELTEIYKSGRGSVKMRGEWKLEEASRGKQLIVISSVPYAINKSQLVEKIAGLIVNRKVPQLVDVRDESTDQVRIVLELKAGADPEVAMAYVLKHTPLESNFAVNMTALVPGPNYSLRPEQLSLKSCLQHFLDFRHDVVQRRLSFERKNLKQRIHILEGLVIIYDALDEALKIVRKSSGRSDAAQKLRKRFKLTEAQAFAVVDMRIYQLSKTNIEEIRSELTAKLKRVAEIDKILKSKKKISDLVRADLTTVANAHGDKRRCRIDRGAAELELNEADYVVKEDVYAIVTADGWLKRIRQNNELSTTRVREGDRIVRAHPLSTLDSVVFLTSHGYLYVLKVTEFPASSGYGTPIQKILKFRDREVVVATFGLRQSEEDQQTELLQTEDPHLLKLEEPLVLISKKGLGFGLVVEDVDGVKRNGKRIMKLREGDTLSAVTHIDKQIAIFTRGASGLAIAKKEIPVRAGAAVGVNLMGVRKEDEVVSVVSYPKRSKILVTTANEKVKELYTDEILKGRRGLKGRKIIARGEVVQVERG